MLVLLGIISGFRGNINRGSDMNIEIKPDDINDIVKNAILKSVAGDAINKAVQKIMSGYDNPIEQVLKVVIKDIATQLITEKYQKQIKDSLANYIEDAVTRDLCDRLTHESITRIRKYALEAN